MCSRCKQVQEETHTHSRSSSNMDNSSRSQNVFPTMTPKIPGIPARCVKIPQCCHRSTQSGRSGHHPDQRSAPDVHRVEVTACLQREKKSKDCADAHWHLLSMTAALTRYRQREKQLHNVTRCIKTQIVAAMTNGHFLCRFTGQTSNYVADEGRRSSL